MAGATARVLGVLSVLFGAVLVLGGAVAFVAGNADAQAYGDNRGMFESDPEREMAHETAMTGGVVGIGIGALFLILGVVMLIARAGGQQQQSVVVTDGTTPAVASQQQGTKAAVTGGAIGVVALLVITVLVAGLAGTGPAAAISDGPNPLREISQDHGSGNIQAGKPAGTVIGSTYEQSFLAPGSTDTITFQPQWNPASDAADRLFLRIWIDDEQRWQGGVASGEIVGIPVDGRQVRVALEPMPDTFVADQNVGITLTYYR